MLTLPESVAGAMHQCYHGPQMVSNCVYTCMQRPMIQSRIYKGATMGKR